MKRKQILETLHKKASMGVEEVHIYDFDSCLFRSPYPPAGWKGGWWGSLISLSPPCVPEEPERSWWVSEVLSQAKDSISKKNVFTILLTGRQDFVFKERVLQLLQSQGLDFDYIALCNKSDTPSFKISEIKNQLERLTSSGQKIKTVKIFDDNAVYLKRYHSEVESFFQEKEPAILVESNHIVALSKESLCKPDMQKNELKPRGGAYLGLFLDSQSQASLFFNFPQAYEKPYGEHITLIYQPSKEVLQEVDSIIGKEYDIEILGQAAESGVQCVAVNIPGLEKILQQKDRIHHITISTQKGVAPKMSNEILKNGWTPSEKIWVKGVLLYK